MVKPQLFRLVQDWEINVGLVRLQLISSSVNGDDLAHILYWGTPSTAECSSRLGLNSNEGQSASNTKALQTMSVLYPEMLDVGCISHFLDQVGPRRGLSTRKTKLNIEKGPESLQVMLEF